MARLASAEAFQAGVFGRSSPVVMEEGSMVGGLVAASVGSIPLTLLRAEEMKAWLGRQPAVTKDWVAQAGFAAKPGGLLRLPDAKGRLAGVVAGVEDPSELWATGGLASALGAGRYRLDPEPRTTTIATRLALGWALGSYRFTRYKPSTNGLASLVWPAKADRASVTRTVEAVTLARDLINTPANDMGPGELAEAARALARRHKARIQITVGDRLLQANYPTIHAVGRAAKAQPRLIDLTWGNPRHPKVTLCGKGVCFDTGGLDLKPASGMRLMKKDMGGAACVLGLAHMVMAARLKLRLRVLVPAVENAVAGDAMRPLDIVKTRKGITVEIGNTDAEGRLILCDALAEADREKPDLILDCATLTGAARVALGPDLPALFANDDGLAAALLKHGTAESDPLWRLPLWQPYKKLLDSQAADINNVSESGFAGAITAALFMQQFVSAETKWAHVDMIAWNPTARPGRPVGGEAQFIRGAFAHLAERYGA
jgi:leucyl aminopeptidase